MTGLTPILLKELLKRYSTSDLVRELCSRLDDISYYDLQEGESILGDMYERGPARIIVVQGEE